MGYSIIFQTKIVKLSDGRILHLDRRGCNNDTEGRRPDDWTREDLHTGSICCLRRKLQTGK